MTPPVARIAYVSDGSVGAAAAEAALRGDAAFALVVLAREPEEAEAQTTRGAVDVVVLHARGLPDARRRRTAEMAGRLGAELVVINADDRRSATLEGVRGRIGAAAACAGGPSAPPAQALCGARPRVETAPWMRLVALGASTGGVEALLEVLSRFPADCPPTVIVQHMPENFTASFAQRLDALCPPRVAEAWDGAPLRPGWAYLAPGGAAHMVVDSALERCVRLRPGPPVNRHRPSVDVVFDSIAEGAANGVSAALLTGMGRDGAAGLKRLRDAGARTVAQDERSSTVYGMPRAALEIGAVDVGTPLEAVADALFAAETRTKEMT